MLAAMGRMGVVDEVDVRDAPLHGATPWQALERVLTLGFRIRGRASRSEYWWWMLLHASVLVVLLGIVPSLFGVSNPQVSVGLAGPFAPIPLGEWAASASEDGVPAPAAITMLVGMLWGVATFVPSITVAVRRLHDANLSGLWLLVSGLPFGPFVLVLMLLRSSQPEGERFDC